MGECGCGEMNIIDSFFVGTKVIAIDFYRGCRDCGADIGIRIHIFTKKEAKSWGIETKDRIEPDPVTAMNQRDLFWIGMSDFAWAIDQYESALKIYDNIKAFSMIMNMRFLKKQ